METCKEKDIIDSDLTDTALSDKGEKEPKAEKWDPKERQPTGPSSSCSLLRPTVDNIVGQFQATCPDSKVGVLADDGATHSDLNNSKSFSEESSDFHTGSDPSNDTDAKVEADKLTDEEKDEEQGKVEGKKDDEHSEESNAGDNTEDEGGKEEGKAEEEAQKDDVLSNVSGTKKTSSGILSNRDFAVPEDREKDPQPKGIAGNLTQHSPVNKKRNEKTGSANTTCLAPMFVTPPKPKKPTSAEKRWTHIDQVRSSLSS